MDLMKTDYEFLDLSDVKETERDSLRVTLFEVKVDKSAKINRVKPIIESGPGSSGELAGDDLTPHSPQRGGAPPPYAPPSYVPPWAPPNVYVSQVTANVNVHGYMGQYYQQPTFPAPERPPRTHRRTDRRHKRPPSPPPQPPPYYVHYPPYYGQQSAPLYLYHQPVAYVGHYPYHYYPEYPVPVDAEQDKAPEEYPPEVVMEQEAVDAYYAGAHYAGPSYGPPVEGPVEYVQPMYVPPMPHPPHMPMPQQPPVPHQTAPHQFNVHAKNFIHNPMKNYAPPPESKPSNTPTHEPKPSPPVRSPVDSLTIKELKITSDSKPSTSASASSASSEKASPLESPKSVQATPEPPSPPPTVPKAATPPAVPAPATVPAPVPVPVAPAAVATKPTKSKSPAAPFPNSKPSSKPASSAPKAPFGNRQRREEEAETPLPPSKAPVPISINLQSAGAPLIVSNKSPFGRKPAPAASPPPPPPPAPTASDFPPPPTPRHRVEPAPTAPATPATPSPAAPGKSWASLFNKATEETISQKPVAKVPPFDASPKPSVSYSEKTSVATPTSTPTPGVSGKTSVRSVSPETREVPIVKETSAPPSLFADDPNSYRMGEFLSKYQLEHKSVPLLPRGLTNRSNYCYVNAILQALIACPPFYNMLKALPYQTRRGKSSTPIIDATVELCYEFTLLPPNTRVSRSRGTESTSAGALPIQTGAPLDPSAGQKVLRALRPFPGSQEGRQEDAEEFLSCLLNGLNDEMLELIKLVEPEDKEEQANGVVMPVPEEIDDDDDDWKVMGPRNKGAVERRWPTGRTPLADIFRGRTRCRTTRAPHTHTDNVQPFFTLQLDIERSNNVKEALELLGGKDALEGVGDSWQQLSIEQPPVVLLLHLKCFQLHADGHPIKIVKNFDYPIELKIDPKVLSPKMKYTAKQKQYKLFAVVYHEGVEAVKGHYLTDTYHGQAGWIRYDDSTVTLVSDAQVLKPKPPKMPYLLMYRRMDMIPTLHRSNTKTE